MKQKEYVIITEMDQFRIDNLRNCGAGPLYPVINLMVAVSIKRQILSHI